MIDRPMPWNEAIRYVLDKEPNPQEWDSSDWAVERPAIKVRSFFSSRVENARFLDRMQGLLFDYMAKVRDDVTTPSGERTTALRVGGREDFVMLALRFMVAEGIADADEFKGVNQNDLTDIRSEARLKLIFDTNIRQAYGFAQWKQGMKPEIRRAFPASRFIRIRDVIAPRERHAAHEGDVRLKTDRDWWAGYQNDPLIGGFGVPWPPYGFNSGMDQEDVPRREAIKLGLVRPDEQPPPQPPEDMNEGLAAAIRRMDPEVKRKLIEELRNRPRRRRSMEDAAREAIENGARPQTLPSRPAVPTGDEPLNIVEDGEQIRVITEPPAEPTPFRKSLLNEALALREKAEKGEASTEDNSRLAELIVLLRVWFPAMFE